MCLYGMNPFSLPNVARVVVMSMSVTAISVPMILMVARFGAKLIIPNKRDTNPMSHCHCRSTSNRDFA